MSNVTIGPPGVGSLPTANSIDPVQDYIPIYTNSLTATQAINRNTYLNLASNPVGLTDTQTLTNKTFTSPTIAGPTFSGTLSGTYTIGGTPTFPSTIVTTTGTQTLTNKTFTSPTISSPTITNATISADAITGFTTAGSGTIYGLSIAGGAFTTTGIIGTTGLQTNAVQAAQLATNAITLGYAQITSNATTTSGSAAAISGLSVNVTIPAGGRRVKITVFTGQIFNSSATTTVASIWSGATLGTLTTQLQSATLNSTGDGTSTTIPMTVISIITPSSGSVFYTAALNVGAGTGTFTASSTAPGFILVEMI